MKKVGRNDPCPCGSGKKYKQCCLKAEEAKTARAASDRSEAVPRAIQWLMLKHGQGVRQALDDGFFGTLSDDEYERLQVDHADALHGIFFNAMEWLLADGTLLIQGHEHRVADLLLQRGGPLFSAEQRQWIELLTSTGLGLYEVVDVVPGESLLLRDILCACRVMRLQGQVLHSNTRDEAYRHHFLHSGGSCNRAPLPGHQDSRNQLTGRLS